jgi:hypothetical protein
MPEPIKSVPLLVKQLYKIVQEFEKLFPGRRFTPDGHLVGSIGEVIAAHRYQLTLVRAGEPGYDAITDTNLCVEIKITQGKGVGLRAEPEHLLVFFLTSEGEAQEIYNGPGAEVWNVCGSLQKNGQRRIGLAKLKRLMQKVDKLNRLPFRRKLTNPVAGLTIK